MNTVHSSQFTAVKDEPRLRRVHSSRAGFTLIELLIAVTITIIAMAAVYTSYIAQQRSFTTQDQVAETQASSKIAFNMLINDIRSAGFGYPATTNPSVNGFTNNIVVCDGDNCGNTTGPDAITLVGGFRQVATLAVPAVIGLNTISITYTGSTKLNLSDRSYLTIDGIDFASVVGCSPSGSECQDGVLYPLSLNKGLNKPFPAGRPVYLVEDVTYCMDSSNIFRKITRSAIPSTCSGGADDDRVAENIDDIQFAFAVDTDGDGEVNDPFGCANPGVLDPCVYLTPPLPANSEILAVRASILASTGREDPNLEPSTKPYYSSNIVLENNTTVDTDKLRRRIWSMDVALRNPR